RLPEGASLNRTDAMLDKLAAHAAETEGVDHVVSYAGRNPMQGTTTPNFGSAYLTLLPFDERDRSAREINAEMNRKLGSLQEGFTFSIMPPPILGLGSAAGYSLYIEDRANLGYGALQEAVNSLQRAIVQTPGFSFPISSYQANVPQL